MGLLTSAWATKIRTLAEASSVRTWVDDQTCVCSGSTEEVQRFLDAVREDSQSLRAKISGDDKAKLNAAMMEMYRTEKINPLGGCLPMVVQIPVFIALYWVLLGSVEMRGAPWLGWITDLSLPDQYYVLPILVGISQIVTQWMTPQAGVDPAQQRMMMIMPVVFSVFFFFFPSGLVLYWVVNNILSIAQQWQITRMIESGADPDKKPKKKS